MPWTWIAFLTLIIALLALDLGVFHRRSHAESIKAALGWSAFWIALALCFGGVIYVAYEHHYLGLGTHVDPVDGQPLSGADALFKYLTAYVVEKSLSVDNLFVIALVFGAFAVPAAYQHRVLFWGVIGALIMRGVMIAAGATLLARYHWLLYVFGGFLLFTAVKLLFSKGDAHADPNKNLLVRATRRLLPVTPEFHGDHLLARLNGRAALTPLALSLVAVEASDAVFAVDSIPAVFAITGDPFLVFTSNVFAMLGLRSLYFALANLLTRFRHLKTALAVVLAIVGAKMLAAPWLHDTLGPHASLYLLALILLTLTTGILASLIPSAEPATESQTHRGRHRAGLESQI